MTEFLIVSTVRSLIFQALFSYLTSSIFPNVLRRRAVAAAVALTAAAGLDGASARGWELEYVLGHPFYFYLFANMPAVLAVLVLLLLVLDRRPDTESRP